jgi:uncharacterized protein (UPF0335 family)
MGVVPMKDDADFRKHNQKATEAAAEELRRFVSALEALDMEMADLQRERKDVFTVVRSKGYDVKALRKVVAERKRDAAELAEEREIMALYQQLLL